VGGLERRLKSPPTNRKQISPPTALGGALLFFSFFFFLHHPTLFRWKRALRFASPGLALAPRFCHPRVCGDPFFAYFRVFPCHSVAKTNRPMERSPWALKSFINPNRMQCFFPCSSVAKMSFLLLSFPCFCFCFFREIPCSSVANSFASALCFFRVSASAFSVSFRG
jgi:hypothetical protein